MRYFKYNDDKKFPISYLVITDDEMLTFKTSNREQWHKLDKHRLNTLKRLWNEITEDNAFLEMV